MRTTRLEDRIIELARANGDLAEVCDLVEYYPDLGKVPEHWRVKPYFLRIVKDIADEVIDDLL